MPTQATTKPASERQMAYIKRLQAEIGEDAQNIGNDMTTFEASQMISQLIAQAGKNGTRDGHHKPVRINEPRLGMAMKETFRYWMSLGRDVCRG